MPHHLKVRVILAIQSDVMLSYSSEFHGMDHELLQKSLQVLVKRGKAQVFGQDDQQGVKFF
jgi:hypothetical protein